MSVRGESKIGFVLYSGRIAKYEELLDIKKGEDVPVCLTLKIMVVGKVKDGNGRYNEVLIEGEKVRQLQQFKSLVESLHRNPDDTINNFAVESSIIRDSKDKVTIDREFYIELLEIRQKYWGLCID